MRRALIEHLRFEVICRCGSNVVFPLSFVLHRSSVFCPNGETVHIPYQVIRECLAAVDESRDSGHLCRYVDNMNRRLGKNSFIRIGYSASKTGPATPVPRFPLVERPGPYVMVVDREKRITFVNDHWERFAVENDAPELAWGRVLGADFTSFIDGHEEQMLQSQIVKKVWLTGKEVVYPFRCDTATTRRHMIMSVRNVGNGLVEFRSRIVKVLPRRKSVTLLERHRQHSQQIVEVCSWCRRIEHQRWGELEEASDATARIPPVSRNITCADCRDLLVKTIQMV